MKKLLLLLLLWPSLVFGADVALQWDAVPDLDWAGYNIYQADRIGDHSTAWVKITPTLIRINSHTVVGLDDANYVWVVTAVDLAGNESFVSNMVERFDRTPPYAPTNLGK